MKYTKAIPASILPLPSVIIGRVSPITFMNAKHTATIMTKATSVRTRAKARVFLLGASMG